MVEKKRPAFLNIIAIICTLFTTYNVEEENDDEEKTEEEETYC